MKTNCCFVDTSAFVALNNPNDQYYNQALSIAEKLTNYHFVLSEAILTETYSLLRYRLGYHTARRFLLSVIENPHFEIMEVTPKVRGETIELLEKYNDHKISYCDALSVALMKINKIEEIFSFDNHFEIMGVKFFYK